MPKGESKVSVRRFAECFQVHGSWGPRSESISDLAERTNKFLGELKKVDPVFKNWQASLTVDDPVTSSRRLQELFEKGIHRESYPPYKTIDGLGSAITIHTRGDWTLPLHIHAGSYCNVRNSLHLDLPAGGDDWIRVSEIDILTRLFKAFVRWWDVDFAEIGSYALWQALGEPKYKFPAGWITYVSHRVERATAFRQPITVHPLSDYGSLVFATTERFSSQNTTHVDAVRLIATAWNS